MPIAHYGFPDAPSADYSYLDRAEDRYNDQIRDLEARAEALDPEHRRTGTSSFSTVETYQRHQMVTEAEYLRACAEQVREARDRWRSAVLKDTGW